MNSSWLDSLLAWISAHPVAAGAVIFAIAFCDALIVVGSIVPALPLLFAVGMLIGMGEISGPYAVASASLGAFAGDGISFWVGRRWGDRLRGVWPFRRYPQLLERGELMFRRNAFSALLVARYVGAIRPFVPAIAGMAKMPVRRYLLISAVACISWGVLFLLPGWILGQAYDAVAAVAGRLALVLGLVLAVMVAAWFGVLYTYRWFADHADALLSQAIQWSHDHPVLGRYSAAVFDPQRRESVPLALLAVMLLVMAWVCFAFLGLVVGQGEPLGIDLALYQLMQALRNPLADQPLAAIASLGDWPVLVPAAALVMAYLCWRRRWMAAAHWLAALVFGLALTTWLGAVVDIPKPPSVSSGFGFPSVAVTMATVEFGFFAVLIARELPGRRRIWPYLIAGVVVALIGFARLYLGAHWLSDIIGGVLLGIVWLLGLGVAYRRRVNRAFWMKPLAITFYGAIVLAFAWYAPRNIEPKLARFEYSDPGPSIDFANWWRSDWQALPARRNELDDEQRWPLDIQVAGSLAPLQAKLEAAGWRSQAQAGWLEALSLMQTDLPNAEQPVLPATLDTRAESLLMLRQGANPSELYALRLWPAPAQLHSPEVPLWLGSAQLLRHHQAFNLFGLWRPSREDGAALQAVADAVEALPNRQGLHPGSHLPVLLIDTRNASVKSATESPAQTVGTPATTKP